MFKTVLILIKFDLVIVLMGRDTVRTRKLWNIKTTFRLNRSMNMRHTTCTVSLLPLLTDFFIFNVVFV